MAQLTLPKQVKPTSIKYANMLGVDYRADPTEADRKRSPDMVNLISDAGGDPIKRDGYRSVQHAYKGMVVCNGDVFGVTQNNAGGLAIIPLTLSGNTITEDTAHATYVTGHDFGEVYSVYGHQDNVVVLTEIGIVLVDTTKSTNNISMSGIDTGMMSQSTVGESAPSNASIIPETSISLKPNGTDGTSYEDKNIFSIYQRCTYLGDGTSTEYKIPAYQKMGNWVKCEIMDSNGDWQVTTAYTLGTATSATGKSLDGTTTITSNIVDAKVTFTNAPSTPVITGEPNVRITFAPYSLEQIDSVNRGFYNATLCRLLSSNVSTIYNNRLFISDADNAYYSEVSRLLMFGDNKWFDVDNTIISFTRTSSYLAIITKDNGRNTIFLASAITEAITGESAFAVKPSNAGVGAITNKCTGVLNDEPVFLATTGIFGILTNWQSEKYAVNRSGRINRKLCKEQGLENAVGIPFNGYYYLAINGKMYVLDSRHKDSQKNGENGYECYYFDSIPTVNNMFVVNNRMFFTDSINTYTWNSDLDDRWRYLDNAVYHAEQGETPAYWSGEPVKAKWSSTLDDGNYPQMLKTLQKKGSMITVKPYAKSGCDITLVKDGSDYTYIGHFDSSVMSFANIDFSSFTFKGNATNTDIFTKKKIKKYKRLQIVVKNEDAEPFGLTSLVITFVKGNYAKR